MRKELEPNGASPETISLGGLNFVVGFEDPKSIPGEIIAYKPKLLRPLQKPDESSPNKNSGIIKITDNSGSAAFNMVDGQEFSSRVLSLQTAEASFYSLGIPTEDGVSYLLWQPAGSNPGVLRVSCLDALLQNQTPLPRIGLYNIDPDFLRTNNFGDLNLLTRYGPAFADTYRHLQTPQRAEALSQRITHGLHRIVSKARLTIGSTR